jgi:hypothetical protein
MHGNFLRRCDNLKVFFHENIFKQTTLQRIILTLTVVLSALTLFGQGKRIILQIDTLILNGYDEFSISITEQRVALYYDVLDESVYIKNTVGYPNFICPLVLKTDSSKIQISLDDQGGYFMLTDAYKLKSDTLKINKFVVFNNCYRDTIFTHIEYYIKKPSGSTGEPFKTKYFKKISKEKCKIRPLTKTSYRINNILYPVSFQKQKDTGIHIMTFHGYKPQRYLKDRDNYKGKVTYFHGRSMTIHYINVIILKIKNGTF